MHSFWGGKYCQRGRLKIWDREGTTNGAGLKEILQQTQSPDGRIGPATIHNLSSAEPGEGKIPNDTDGLPDAGSGG